MRHTVACYAGVGDYDIDASSFLNNVFDSFVDRVVRGDVH
jgi:hypothetical protein